MLLARGIVLHQVLLQLVPHRVGPIDAHANQPRSTSGKRLDRRDSDCLFKALSDNERFAQIEVHCATHSAAPRLAAAIASWAFV